MGGSGTEGVRLPDTLVWTVWARMQSLFAHKWTSAMGEHPWVHDGDGTRRGPGLEWQRGLAGLDEGAIERGLARCRQARSWPPSLGEFRDLCLPDPAEYGLPDEEGAFEEAARNANPSMPASWSHDCVIVAFRRVGREILRGDARQARKAWAKVWRQVVREWMDGRIEAEAEAALPPPGKSSAPRKGSKEAAQHGTDAMRRALGMAPKYEEAGNG